MLKRVKINEKEPHYHCIKCWGSEYKELVLLTSTIKLCSKCNDSPMARTEYATSEEMVLCTPMICASS